MWPLFVAEANSSQVERAPTEADITNDSDLSDSSSAKSGAGFANGTALLPRNEVSHLRNSRKAFALADAQVSNFTSGILVFGFRIRILFQIRG